MVLQDGKAGNKTEFVENFTISNQKALTDKQLLV